MSAALELVADVGPDGLTHRMVAVAAGVSLSSTTYWFASKEELIEAVFVRIVDDAMDDVVARRSAIPRWRPRTAAAELAKLIREDFTTHRKQAILGNALWVEAQRRPSLRLHARRWVGAYLDLYVDLLRHLGVERELAARARLLLAAYDGLLAEQLATDVVLSSRQLIAILAPLLQAP
ncbi:TetR/AcrR family transcriptional regulator [uncultured Jatrophihabitans sp.]|uniref:TetR/AcrR family transcriptional regulator n=1 Tax=uncultured Jatrophihabitans sp. TaxID=1610747 RepID=UPI0035CC0429